MPFDGQIPTEPCAPEREPGCVRAVILYNPLDPNERDIADIQWEAGKTVAQYLDGLPDNVSWTVAAAGRVLEREEWDQVTLVEDDAIVLAVTPEGRGGQAGWMIVAAVALAVVSAGVGAAIAGGALAGGSLAGATGLSFAAGSTSALVAGAVAGAAISVGGSLLMNAIFPASAGKVDKGGDETSSPSYSLSGPQPTAKENTPLPIVYGEFRTGGNRINAFIKNVAEKTQDVYLQYAVSEGEIESISDLEINDQPASNFRDVEMATRNGLLGQSQLNWIIDTPTGYADGRTLSTTPALYTTVDAVDRVELDIAWPSGLFSVDQEKGRRGAASASIYATLTPVGGGSSILIQGNRWEHSSWSGQQVALPGTAIRVTVAVTGANGNKPFTAYNARCVIRQSTDSTYWTALDETRTGQVSNSYVSPTSWSAGTDLLVFTFNDANLSNVTERNFQVQVTGGTITSIEVLRKAQNVVTRSERNAFQITFDSGPLPRARYQMSVWRGEPESTSDYVSNKMVLAQVREIQNDPVRYNRTAYYAVKVRLSDQLNGVPKTTVLVRGRKLDEYDANGNVITRQWSNNPADVALDILLSRDNYRPMPKSRIDFPWFRRWRSFCIANNLVFNGVFDYQTNVWDALVQVMRVGRASPSMSGLKWSGVMEAPDVPVMMFGSQNIVKGSFRNNWLGRAGRANHIEGQYYDKNDGFKQRSVYASDDAAIANGNDIIQASINLIGVTDAEQAQKEVDLQLQINRLVVQGCSFSAMTDAIGCRVGDVIYVQHDMPKWGWGDVVQGYDSTTKVLQLTNPLQAQEPAVGGLLPDGDWRVLVLKPAIQRDTATISAVSGPQITVSKVIPTTTRVTRIVIAGQDYQVLDRAVFSTTTVFLLDRTPPVANGTTIQAWETDVLAEGKIARPAANATSLTVNEWTHGFTINAGDQIMIGRTGKFKKQFRVIKFAYDTDQTRTIECLEYVPEIYTPLGTAPDTDYSELQAFPLQVSSLSADQTTEDVNGGGVRYFAVVNWLAPLNDQRGHAGSRVYVSVNNGDFFLHENVPLGRFSSRYEANLNDIVRFKVVAYDLDGYSAQEPLAPIVAVTIGRRVRAPLPPTNLSATGSIRLISLSWTRPADTDIKLFEVFENSVNDLSTAYKVGESTSNGFARTGLDPRVTRYYWVRSVSYAGEASVTWLGPASATTQWLIAADIQDGVLNTAKFASSIAPISLPAAALDLPGLKQTNNVIFPQTALTDPVTGQVLSAQRLYRWTGTQWVAVVSAPELAGQLTDAQIAGLNAAKLDGKLDIGVFPANARPIEIVSTLPSTGNFVGRTVILTTDGKIYRHLGSPAGAEGFSAKIPAVDLTGQIGRTQIADNSISTQHLITNAVTADKINSKAITADKLDANSVSAGAIQAGAISADKIQANTIGASKLLLGDTQNTYPDFDMLDAPFYASSTSSPFSFLANSTGSLGANTLCITASANAGRVESDWFTVESQADYAVRGAAFTENATSGVKASLEIEFGALDSAGAITPTRKLLVIERTNSTVQDLATLNVLTAANERRARFVMSKSAVAGAQARFGGFTLRRRYNGSLIVDGSISASNLAAGAVTTEKLSVGSPNNLIWNSCLSFTTSGWAEETPGSLSRVIDPDWRVSQGTGLIAGDGLANNADRDIFWAPNGPGTTAAIPAAPGQAWEAQAKLLPLNGVSAAVYLTFYDAAGLSLGSFFSAYLPSVTASDAKTLSRYTQLSSRAIAPANTAFVRMSIRARNANTGAVIATPRLYFTQALLGRTVANATQDLTWTVGGVTEIDGAMVKTGTLHADAIISKTITSDHIAANSIETGMIQAGAIKSAQIDAGEIKAVNLAADEVLIKNTAQMGAAVIQSANIVDLTVTTLKIKNNAITATSTAEWWGNKMWGETISVVNGDTTYAAQYLIHVYGRGVPGGYWQTGNEGNSYWVEVPLELTLYRNSEVLNWTNTRDNSSYMKTEYLAPGFYTWQLELDAQFQGYANNLVLVVTKILK